MIGVVRMKAADPTGAFGLPNAVGNVYAKPAFINLAATTEKTAAAFIMSGRGEDGTKNEHRRNGPNKPQSSRARDLHIKLMLASAPASDNEAKGNRRVGPTKVPLSRSRVGGPFQGGECGRFGPRALPAANVG